MLLLQGRRPVHDRAPLAVDGGSGLGADAIAPGLQPASRRGYAAAPGEGGRPVEPAVPVTNKQAGKRLCIRDLRTEAQNRAGLSAGQDDGQVFAPEAGVRHDEDAAGLGAQGVMDVDPISVRQALAVGRIH